MNHLKLVGRPTGETSSDVSPAVLEAYLDTIKIGLECDRGRFTKAVGTDDQWNALIDAYQSQLRVTEHLRKLQRCSQQHCGRKALFEETFSPAHNELARMQSILERALGWNPLQTAPTATSATKAQEVFLIAELADEILSLLPAKDLLSLMQVNKTLYGHVNSSRKIQVFLGLAPDQNSFLTSIFDRPGCKPLLPSLRCALTPPRLKNYTEDGDEKDYQYGVVLASFQASSSDCRESGSRTGAILLCQPPMKEMTAVPHCCWTRNMTTSEKHYRIKESKKIVMHSTSGLTVKDLQAAAERLASEHRKCPFAKLEDHDPESGDVDVRVVFQGEIYVRSDDPIRTDAKRRSRAKRECRRMAFRRSQKWNFDVRNNQERSRLMKERREVMGEYITAKIKGVVHITLPLP